MYKAIVEDKYYCELVPVYHQSNLEQAYTWLFLINNANDKKVHYKRVRFTPEKYKQALSQGMTGDDMCDYAFKNSIENELILGNEKEMDLVIDTDKIYFKDLKMGGTNV